MLFKILFFVLLAIDILAAIVFLPRNLKDRRLKKEKRHTYAIQNVGTNLCIRPYNADFSEGNKVIQYPLHNWECITWQFIKTGDDTFLLQNLYTHKSFAPQKGTVSDSSLHQETLDGTSAQLWDFLKEGNEYRIRLHGTQMYLSAKNAATNSDIVLKVKSDDANQKWRLIEQHPTV